METKVANGKHDEQDHDDHKLVEITVDGQTKEIERGNYKVPEFKQLVGIAADKILDQVIDGKFVELKDTDHIKIKGGEKFVSHGSGGGSS